MTGTVARMRLAARLKGRSPVRDGFALALLFVLVGAYVAGFATAAPGWIGRDLALYQHVVQAWLGGAPMYPSFELAGPFDIVDGVILYPPIAIALFGPTLLLPLPLWWLIPAGVVAWVLWQLRPHGRWLLAIGLCLAFPVSVNLVVAGNPDMWLAAGLAVAIYWRPAAAIVFLKPSLFPLALVGIRSRGWWAAVGLLAIGSLALLPQTLDWLTVLRNSQGVGGGHASGLLYSLWDLPLLAVPLLAWAGSDRPRGRLAPARSASAERDGQDPGPEGP